MRKRIIVIILALGLVSFCVVSSIISANQSEQDRLTANATQNAYNDAASATFTAIDVEAAATNTEAPTATAIANTEATQTALQIALTPTPSTVTVDLLTAVNERLVTVSFMSTGGASGNVINITLNRFKSQNSEIHVTLPPGLLLTNSDPSEQNMILEDPTPTEMDLSPQDTTTSLNNVVAYCLQLHKGNPTNGTSLMLSGQASSDLVSLMKAAAARNDSILVIQAAW